MQRKAFKRSCMKHTASAEEQNTAMRQKNKPSSDAGAVEE